jgi:hypothetical protein
MKKNFLVVLPLEVLPDKSFSIIEILHFPGAPIRRLKEMLL